MKNLLAQATDFFGQVTPPPGIEQYGDLSDFGLIKFANNLLKLLIVIGGLYTFINIIFAGFGYMSAGGDSKKISDATTKIWQSIIGLVIMAGSFVIAALVGWLLFKDATAILNPKIYGPQ